MRKVNRKQTLRKLWKMVEKVLVLHSENAEIGGRLSPRNLLFILSRRKQVQGEGSYQPSSTLLLLEHFYMLKLTLGYLHSEKV